jgi:two-component system, NarL family, nitrate/nitrite response regulator NarL
MTIAFTKTLRLLLIDDHALFRESIASVLAEPDLEVQHCATIRDGVHMLAEQGFDLVLLDHDLGVERASLFLPAAREAGVEPRVLVVTAWISENEARRLLRQGVSGIFLKQAPLQELKEAIQLTAAGGTYLDRSFSRMSGESGREREAPVFNDRQRRVLHFVLEGLSNKEIAWRLQISESYVKAILQSLFKKIGVRTRGQLVRVAFEQYENEL